MTPSRPFPEESIGKQRSRSPELETWGGTGVQESRFAQRPSGPHLRSALPFIPLQPLLLPMSTMQAARLPHAGADFELVDLPVPDPDANEVRVRVEARGICHSDAFVKEGTFPGLEYPRVPGHEVAGVIDAVGSDVSA